MLGDLYRAIYNVLLRRLPPEGHIGPRFWLIRASADVPGLDEGRTWIVTKMWGRNTEPVLERLTKLAPEQSGIGYEAVPS
jgi:hypothetical protein